jgi:hypothetical protein
MIEFLDRRALGAIEFVDAITAARMRAPLRVEPSDERVVITTNRSALYVIRSAPGLEHHLGEFEQAPATPALGSLDFGISASDPAHRYLSRTTRIKLPRKDAPQSDAQSVLNPIVVPLYPASAAAVGSNWAVLRARVQDGTARGLSNVLVVVSPQLAGFSPVTAVTDERGEALVAVTGVAPVLPSGGGAAVLTREFSCDVTVVLDRRVVRVEPAVGSNPPPDPESIAADRLAGSPDVVVKAQPSISLSASKSVRVTMEITWP